MRNHLFLCIVALLLCSAPVVEQPSGAAAEQIALVGGTLIDGNGRAPVKDAVVLLEGDRIVKSKNACSLGDAWFQNHTAERLYPDALVDGKPTTVDAAVEAAAGLLYDAHMPLVYGLSNITCEAQREAVALAELIGGVIDSHTSL